MWLSFQKTERWELVSVLCYQTQSGIYIFKKKIQEKLTDLGFLKRQKEIVSSFCIPTNAKGQTQRFDMRW